MCSVIGKLHVLDAWSVRATRVIWKQQRGMWRCRTLRRFMERGRSAGAQTAAGRGAVRVYYLWSLQNTSKEDMFGEPSTSPCCSTGL
jgi:hypothetical protein